MQGSASSRRLLNDGKAVPRLAFGTATVHIRKECSAAVLLALQKGFRHIDTAHGYENEESVGIVLKKWGGRREDVFLTSKWGWSKTETTHDAEAQLKQTLKALGVDYLDMSVSVLECQGMEEDGGIPRERIGALYRGERIQSRAYRGTSEDVENKAIGQRSELSVWSALHEYVVEETQVEYHPYCFHDPRMISMMETCEKYDIAISPFTSLAPLTRFPGGCIDETIMRVANERGLTSAQVLLAWALDRASGGPLSTTASKDWQYSQILEAGSVRLSEEELQAIDEAGGRGGTQSRYTLPDWNDAVAKLQSGS